MIITAEALGLMASGNVVLMAFIGGIGQFWGPMIGAVLVTWLQSALSNFTQAWLLYFGLLFLIHNTMEVLIINCCNALHF